MIFKLITLIKTFKKILIIFEYEWQPDTMKEQEHKHYLVKQGWANINYFTQELKIDRIKG